MSPKPRPESELRPTWIAQPHGSPSEAEPAADPLEKEAGEEEAGESRWPDEAPLSVAPFGAAVSLDEACREVRRLHAQLLSTLLQEAAGIAAPAAPYFGVLATFPLPRRSHRLWRRAAVGALELAREADDAVPGFAWVERLTRTERERWPSCVALAAAARRVRDGELARICHGFALLCEGQSERAVRSFSRLLRCSELLRHRWRVLEGLGLAHAARGRERLALGAIESAADDPLCGLSALVEGLHLALLVGDRPRVRRAAARLDLLVDATSPGFASALAVLGRRRQRRPRELTLETLSLVRELARDLDSPSARVARATM